MQWLATIVLVVLAACYASWRLLTADAQLRLLQALRRWTAEKPVVAALHRATVRALDARANASGGCNSCSAHPGAPNTSAPKLKR